MALINLSQGYYALIDDDMFGWLILWKWYVKKSDGIYYATRDGCRTKKIHRTIPMHRQILGLKYGDGKQVDHLNHNGLDNRRCNLRICTRSQNQMNNRKCRTKTTSKYKGVCRYLAEGRWQAYIMVDQKQFGLGHFDTEIEAAKAYNVKAKELFGEFANINEIT